MNRAGLMLLAAALSVGTGAFAQGNTSPEGDQLLARSIKSSMLTYDGKPFHAIMEIAPGASDPHPSPGPEYTGKVEVWWAGADKYRISAVSPSFTLDRSTVAGEIEEKHTGEFYPRWLETFVRVLTDPVPVGQFSSAAGATFSGGTQISGFSTQPCIRRDDKTAGITNDLTWGQLCFTGPILDSVTSFNYSVYMDDWHSFEGKDIARKYDVFLLDSQRATGQLTTLEPLTTEDAAKIVVTTATPASDRINTQFISTLKEESMLDHAPKIDWPPVREGKTDGYMIVYARTDRSGQVRESSTHNSDNPGLEAFGMQQALGYKFKPLIVDGVAQQMEMPLVLHFTSKADNPIPILTLQEMKKQIISCRTTPVPSGALSSGEHAIVRVSVDEKGKVTGSQPMGQARWGLMMQSLISTKTCQFHPYLINGKPTYYKGDIEIR